VNEVAGKFGGLMYSDCLLAPDTVAVVLHNGRVNRREEAAPNKLNEFGDQGRDLTIFSFQAETGGICFWSRSSSNRWQ
jgi:hypothetical protein